MNIEQYSSLEHFSARWLCGQVVIAFRSNLPCFWEIWRVAGSIPLSGRWFFFFVQINFYKLFIYACILYNDKKQSKVSGNLSKITLNFWTVWSNAKGNIAKSNKWKLWNRLSYRGLPYLFEVRSQTFRYDFQKIEVAASLIQHLRSFDLNDLERPQWELKKMSWDNPVFPIDAKNSIGFFVHFFFWVSLDL